MKAEKFANLFLVGLFLCIAFLEEQMANTNDSKSGQQWVLFSLSGRMHGFYLNKVWVSISCCLFGMQSYHKLNKGISQICKLSVLENFLNGYNIS